jgi:U3 small nucleolar RNA-associated protein 14
MFRLLDDDDISEDSSSENSDSENGDNPDDGDDLDDLDDDMVDLMVLYQLRKVESTRYLERRSYRPGTTANDRFALDLESDNPESAIRSMLTDDEFLHKYRMQHNIFLIFTKR